MLPIAEQLTRALTERRMTIAAAESCTGGLIGHLLTDVPGSSKVFPGGVVAYANAPKSRVLGVDEALLREHGAVSAEAAAAMAEGVRRLLSTDIGVAATGIAGPTGGSADKPVGTVFIACADAAGQTVERHQWSGEREDNKQRTATAAIELVLRRLGG